MSKKLLKSMEAQISVLARKIEEARKLKIQENFGLLIESELEKAELVLASKGILDKLQDMAEDLAKIEANDLMPMLDNLRLAFGPNIANKFNDVTTAGLRSAVETLKTTKDEINTQILYMQAIVDGESPANDMGGEDNPPDSLGDDLGGDAAPTDTSLGDAGTVDDTTDDMNDLLSGGDDALVSGSPEGREKKEESFANTNPKLMEKVSKIAKNVKALQEAENPDTLIFAVFAKAIEKGFTPSRAVEKISENFAIDKEDIILIVKEARDEYDDEWGFDDEDRYKKKNRDKSIKTARKNKQYDPEADDEVVTESEGLGRKDYVMIDQELNDMIKNPEPNKLVNGLWDIIQVVQARGQSLPNAQEIIKLAGEIRGASKEYETSNQTPSQDFMTKVKAGLDKINSLFEGMTEGKSFKRNDDNYDDDKKSNSKNRRDKKKNTRKIDDKDEDLEEGKSFKRNDDDYDDSKKEMSRERRFQKKNTRDIDDTNDEEMEEGAKAKLGTGTRFKNLEKSLSHKGIKNPAALAASIGDKKYGVKKMAKMAHHESNIPGNTNQLDELEPEKKIAETTDQMLGDVIGGMTTDIVDQIKAGKTPVIDPNKVNKLKQMSDQEKNAKAQGTVGQSQNDKSMGAAISKALQQNGVDLTDEADPALGGEPEVDEGWRYHRKKGISVPVSVTDRPDKKVPSTIGEDDSDYNYHIIDSKTGDVVGRAKTLSAAHRSADKRDLAYGSYRYSVKRITPFKDQ